MSNPLPPDIELWSHIFGSAYTEALRNRHNQAFVLNNETFEMQCVREAADVANRGVTSAHAVYAKAKGKGGDHE